MRRLVTMARYGLGVMRAPVPAVIAIALPDPRLGVPALRRLGGDARVRHPRAAAGRRARARADERRDALPALAGEHRARPGGGRPAARPVRRAVRARASRSASGSRRSRSRSASASGSSSSRARASRTRCSSGCPGADAGRGRRAGGRARAAEEPDACARSRRPLASKASCRRSRRRLRSGRRAARGRGRGRGAARRRRRRGHGRGARRARSAASGGAPRSRTRSGGASRLATSCSRTDGGRRGGRGDRALRLCAARSSTRCARRAAGSASSPRGRAEASGPLLVGLGDTATVDGGAGLLEVVGDALPGATLAVPATCGTRCSASAAPRGRSGRRRAPRPSRSRSSSGGSRRWTSSRPFAELPGRRRRRWPRRGARGSRRGARVRAPSSCSSRSVPRARRAAPTSSSPAKERSTARRSRARRLGEVVRACAKKASAARSSAAGSSRRRRASRSHALQRRPERAADDLVELGERLARAQLGVA